MGDVARALGEGSSLSFRGQTYPIAPLSFEVQAAFEIWLENRAWQAYKRAGRTLSSEEHNRLRSQTAQDIAAGVYSFGSPASAAALQTPVGQKHFLFLLLKKAETGTTPPVTETLVDEIFASDLDEALARVESMSVDPNAQAPAMSRGSPSPVSAPSSSGTPSTAPSPKSGA